MAENLLAKITQLNETNLTKLQALETELGVRIVAFDKQYPLANLSEKQLKQLQTAEKELNVILVAYT